MNHNWEEIELNTWSEFYSAGYKCDICGTLKYIRNNECNYRWKFDYIINGTWNVCNSNISCGEIMMKRVLE